VAPTHADWRPHSGNHALALIEREHEFARGIGAPRAPRGAKQCRTPRDVIIQEVDHAASSDPSKATAA
jgi:hypothetical protein